jgi:hypothetical protein
VRRDIFEGGFLIVEPSVQKNWFAHGLSPWLQPYGLKMGMSSETSPSDLKLSLLDVRKELLELREQIAPTA